MLQQEDSALAAHQEPLGNHTCRVLIKEEWKRQFDKYTGSYTMRRGSVKRACKTCAIVLALKHKHLVA